MDKDKVKQVLDKIRPQLQMDGGDVEFVEIKDNILTLKGERIEDKRVDEENYYRRERCFGTFQRSFNLEQNIQPEKIKAKFKAGVLEVEIPRPEEEKPKKVSVSVD